LNRLVQTIAWSVLALALASGAQAAEAKGGAKKEAKPSVVKKQRAGKGYTSARTTAVSRQARSFARLSPPKPSFGQIAGLHAAPDELDLRSSVALVIDQESGQVLLRKNEAAVLPIASLTKLMTGMIISDAKLPMDESITISQDDVDTEKHTGSRLKVGVTLTRGELMHLSLMSSENRAAHALGRTYPGGMSAFVEAMNTKAKLLGMKDTRYVEPTGLSSRNQSSAQDLAQLVMVASQDPLLSELSTSPGHEVTVGRRTLQFNNTNRLIKNSAWDITLQKTGYISEAGQCLVMQAKVAGRKLVMVFLDSAGKLSRIGDAERVRRWVETQTPSGVPMPTTGGNTLVRQISS
jgi:serine-type D-Ala-D-Ala endopeptidase (penicillin-binding protein 7)